MLEPDETELTVCFRLCLEAYQKDPKLHPEGLAQPTFRKEPQKISQESLK